MGRIESTYAWCLKQGEKGRDHKGLRRIDPEYTEAKNQLNKAKSDLETMGFLFEGSKTDWVASAAFYAMYHSLLALLFCVGLESRNQECSFSATEYFIKNRILLLNVTDLEMLRSMQVKDDAKSLREEMQYGSETSLDEKRCDQWMKKAKEFVEKCEAEYYRVIKNKEEITGLLNSIENKKKTT